MQEFDDIFDKEIIKKYDKHEVQRLSFKRKDRESGIYWPAGRPFKLDVKGRFLMLLVYYRLYITYTLAGFYLIWIKVISVEIYKRLKAW